MKSDNSMVIVNLVPIGAIIAALSFGLWVGRLNGRLRKQNQEERKQPRFAGRLQETNAKSQ